MKLVQTESTALPNSRLRIQGQWRDKMRRPARVSVSVETGPNIPDGMTTLVEGDAKECTDTLFRLAELAWEKGWRPKGLVEALASTVQHLRQRQE